jgi:phospho-N-acetylmuramoyl-pentapeptide-transferase
LLLGGLGAAVGWLAARGRSLAPVLGALRAAGAAGLLAAAAGVVAVLRAQPWEVFYPLLLSGGIMLGLAAVLCKHEVLLPIVGGVFALEMASVVLQIGWFRTTGGKRLFRMAPLHHHFELGGWTETQVVARFMILALLFSMAALATLKIR